MESPFIDEIILENFYAGAGRGELLGRMKSALEDKVPLMIISGVEGSGKTMMCRMLENQCSAATIVVFFPNTVESFEDVVRVVAKKLELTQSATDTGKTIDAVIEQITTHLLQHSRGLLIIFDEAEDIYLATLERIRKMLDRIIASGVRMQVLFSGRRTFLENCEQLSICDFRNTENQHFDLLPLTEIETSEYLQSCLGRMPNQDKRKVFNDEVIRNIHSLAKGRFRRVNILADESLRSHGDDTSFMVLLDSVQDEAEAEDKKEMGGFGLLRRAIPYLLWFGGGLCTLCLLFFLFRAGGERRVIKPVLSSSADKSKVEAVAQGSGGQPPPLQQPVTSEIPQQPIQPPNILSKTPEIIEQKVVIQPETSPSATGQSPAATETKQEIVEQHLAVIKPTPQKAMEPINAPLQSDGVHHSEMKVPELRQNPNFKTKPRTTSEAATTTAKPQTRVEAQEAVGAHLTVDQIFQKRLTAGSVWTSGEKNDKFTVQLMVLTAKNAEENLKKMLAKPNYRQEAGNFFIFKKNGSQEVVTVFYGEYPTMDMAKLAQSSLPQFLRDHQPYAISIKGAIAKVGK